VLFLAHHPLVEQYDLSSTEFVVSGGAPIGKQVESLVHDRLGLHVKQIYGMTELSPAVNYGEDHTRKPVGLAVPAVLVEAALTVAVAVSCRGARGGWCPTRSSVCAA
jgi:acyl-coenzyme A synthetase/AMP-(fatty) acid ligase